MTIRVVTENDVDNVTIIINGDNKLECVPTPAPEMKVFKDEILGYLMDSCGCGAYITRTAKGEDTNIVVDYVKFTTKYTKGEHTVYAGVAESGKEYVTSKGVKHNTSAGSEGGVTWSKAGVQIDTTKDLSVYADYQKEVLGDCCNPTVEVFSGKGLTYAVDACETGAYIKRTTVDGQEVFVDYIKFDTKFTFRSYVLYKGINSAGDEVFVGELAHVTMNVEGFEMGAIVRQVVNEALSLQSLANYTQETINGCGITVEELPHTTFVNDNNVTKDYALRLVVGDQEVGIDRIGKIKGTDWLVFKASKFSL